jgi:hypothetical protein
LSLTLLLGVPKGAPGSSLAVQTKARPSPASIPGCPEISLIVMPAKADETTHHFYVILTKVRIHLLYAGLLLPR